MIIILPCLPLHLCYPDEFCLSVVRLTRRYTQYWYCTLILVSPLRRARTPDVYRISTTRLRKLSETGERHSQSPSNSTATALAVASADERVLFVKLEL